MLPLSVSKTSTLAFFFKTTTSPLVSDLVSTIFPHSRTVSGQCDIVSGRLPCNRLYLPDASPRRHPPAKKFRQTPPTPGTIHQLFSFFPCSSFFLQFLPFILLASNPAQSANFRVACFSQLATVPRQQNLDSSPSCHRSFSADLPQSICPLRTSLRRRLLASASYRPDNPQKKTTLAKLAPDVSQIRPRLLLCRQTILDNGIHDAHGRRHPRQGTLSSYHGLVSTKARC